MGHPPPATRPWGAPAAASGALHVAVALAALWGSRRRSPRADAVAVAAPAAEVSFDAPPPEAPTPAETPRPPSPPVAPQPTPSRARRATAATRTAAPATATIEAPAATGAAPPERPSPPRESAVPRPALRAAELLGAGAVLVPSLAAEGVARERSPEGERERARAVASAPTVAALADSQNRLPTGTVTHDRAVARRAQEFLDPFRAEPDLPARLAAAPVRSMGAIRRTPTAGEVTVGEAADEAHAQSYRTVQMPPGYAPCQDYRALELLAELRHDAAGAVTAARVERSSGSRRLDAVALDALRDGMGEVPPARGGAAPVTRWVVEVGEDRDAHAPLACGSLGGWTVWAPRGSRFGVRVRVRRLRDR